ncbi:MFS transporter [candidate division NPL-UPA2 bacterium]|nr:MFS transporter [candidate division NPL-UPA2 bacterium]
MTESKKLLLSFSSCNFIFYFTSWMVFFYLPPYLKDLGISDTRIGILISIFSLATLLLVAFFGLLSDRFSPKRLMQLGIFLLLGSLAGLYSVQEFAGVFFFLLTAGFGSTLFMVSIFSLYYKHLGREGKGKRIGAFLLSAHFGFSLGPLSGGFIVEQFGGRGIFIFGSGLMFLLLILSTILKDSPPLRFSIRHYRGDLRRQEVFLLIFIVLIMGIHFGAERTSLYLFLDNDVGLTVKEISQIFCFVGLWLGIFSLICGYLFDRNRRVIILISLGLFLSGAGQGLLVFANSYLSALMLRLLHTTGDSFVILSQAVMISTIFPNRRMGGNFGFLETVGMGGTFLGAIVSGVLNEYIPGYASPFILTGLLTVIFSLYLFPQRRLFSRMLK